MIGEGGRDQAPVPIDITHQLAHSTAQSKPGRTRTIHNFYISKSKSFMQPDTGRFQERFLDRQHGSESGIAASLHAILCQLGRSKDLLQRTVSSISGVANTVDRHDIYAERLHPMTIHAVFYSIQPAVGAA